MSGTSSRTSLDLRLGQVLEHEPGPDVHQQRVAGPQGAVAQRLADLHHPLLVGVADDQGPVDPEHLLELDDLALDLVGAGLDHVEGLVEHQLLAGLERLGVDVGMDVDPQLAPARGDVDGAVVVDAQEHPEARWRGGELLDLLEGDDLSGLPEGGGQAFVLGQRLPSWPLVSRRRSSSTLTWRGESCRRRRSKAVSSSRNWICRCSSLGSGASSVGSGSRRDRDCRERSASFT